MKRLIERLNLSETAAVMCTAIGGLFILFLAAGLTVSSLIYPFERPAQYALGLLMGCLLSAAKVVLLEKSLDRSVDMEGKTAQGYANLMAVLRYLLTVAVLLLVFFFRDVFGLFGAIVGILSLQVAAYITGHIIKKRSSVE